jgi:enoyl-CoA hydratase/carnithine racemase
VGPERDRNGLFRFLPVIGKPVIGAINGPAVIGGLDVALQCTFLVASDRARFADTHARVGVMPGGGVTVLLAGAATLDEAHLIEGNLAAIWPAGTSQVAARRAGIIARGRAQNRT